ncbi:MAG: glycoside hydrolase family 13 protein [Ruminococcaceae bacterium]|nr:glycoside hydrolase family 13 protein [Oscillospiraceae bacterium]
MLMKQAYDTELPRLLKSIDGKDVSGRGAFFCRDTLVLTAEVPRALGAAGVVLRIARDGQADRDMPLSFIATRGGTDTYRLSLSLASLCAPDDHGLFYYEMLFVRGADTLFTDTAQDNVTFALAPRSRGRFRLVVSQNEFDTPAWFHGKTMYHIFVDRFAPRGGTRVAGAVYHEDWHEEIEQFGAYPGAPVANNEFFGGTLWGVIDKLDYLASLGVGVLYLSPIFRSVSNHKYDTGDYETVDAQFGGREALLALIEAARARGMGVMLDGVFNHTGDNSRYFDREGAYGGNGAFSKSSSPYYDWFYFKSYPDQYLCWWDIPILPKLNLSNPACHRYFVGEGGIIDTYTKMGVCGWRLDVADELPNAFLDELRVRVKSATNGRGVMLGEVWENAADKIAYGKRRRYFEGAQLDSVMNYPLRRGLISFVKDGNATALTSVLRELWGSYPLCVCHSLMNILSTHDTERILTTFGGEADDGRFTNAELRVMRMTGAERALAKQRLKMAAALQYTVFGVPSLFYGDEAGMEGYHDPFCRRPYPWGKEDKELVVYYQQLGRIRRENPVLAEGDFRIVCETPHALCYVRENEKGRLMVAASNGQEPFSLTLPRGAVDLISGKRMRTTRVTLAQGEFYIWRLPYASSRY